jgi:hypothetical protein
MIPGRQRCGLRTLSSRRHRHIQMLEIASGLSVLQSKSTCVNMRAQSNMLEGHEIASLLLHIHT